MEALIDLALIWCGVFFAVYAARITRLTPVLFFMFVGTVYANTGLLPEKSTPFIATLADVGVIIIMFALGFEENTSNFFQSIKRSWGIALFGAGTPFVVAMLVAWYFWRDTNLALIFGLSMMATAVSLTMVSLKNLGLERSPAATGIMTAAVIDGVSTLGVLAILLPIATGAAPLTAAGLALTAGKAVLFFVIVSILGGLIFPHESTGILRRVPFLRRYGLRHLFDLVTGQHTTLTILTIALLIGILAHELGFHAAIGAYIAGLVIKEEYFALPSNPSHDEFELTKRIIDNAAYSWIGPVFFVNLGTKIIFDWDLLMTAAPYVAVLTSALFFAQIGAASLAARFTGGFKFTESMMIGFGMLGRAELAFVVMDIGYVQSKILTEEAFFTLMATAFLLNVALPIMIAWWKPYYSGTKQLFGGNP